jgi:hypothetical protein
MNKINLLARYDKELRIHMMYPEARREVTGDVVRFIRNAPGMNFVSFTFANEWALDRVIDRELRYFAPMNQPFTWKVYDHDLLPSLKDKLTVRGFVGDAAADVMVLDIHDAPDYLFQSTNVDIRRVTTRAGLKDVVHVLNTVYDSDNSWVYDRLGLHLQIPGYLSVYAAYVENQPASVAWTYFPKGHFAALYGGSTLAEYRKRGLYTSLLSARLKEIRERARSFVVVEAGEMSKSIVARHDFKRLTTVRDFEWQRKAESDVKYEEALACV